MNSKAIKRQLLAAIAMVLVAALALGSSTYAWFVASGTVTATGMSVKAQSEGGLAISFDGQQWGTTATAGMTTKELYPASTRDLTAWYHATAANMNAAGAQPGSRTKITSIVFGGDSGAYAPNNSYVVMREFQIKSSSASDASKGLFVESVDVTGYKTMSTALRVGVKYVAASDQPAAVGTGYKIYAPVSLGAGAENNPTDNYDVYQEKTDDPTTSEVSLGKVKLDTVGQTGSTLIASDGEIPSGTPLTVQIYIWFEGEDANLKSSNFHPEDLSVTVNFSSISGGTTSSSSVSMTGAIADTTAVSATDPETGSAADFYKITNKTGLNNEVLYAKASGELTRGNIYTISGGAATQYTKVTW